MMGRRARRTNHQGQRSHLIRIKRLHKLCRYEEARAEFKAAARLAGNQREHEFLRRRAAESAGAAMTP
jgi:predicted RNA polymerase sigma factor